MGAGGVPLTVGTGLLYAAGDIGSSLTSLCLAFYWLYFLIDVAGLTPLTAGLIHASGYVLSAGANLWAGHLLDRRVPTARGRCLLIAGFGILMAASFALMWMVPADASLRIIWYLALSWAFHLIFALVYLSYLSLTVLLGASEAERVDLGSYRFGGTMALTLVVLALYGATEKLWATEARLAALGATVAIAGAVGALVCGLGLRRVLRSLDFPAHDSKRTSWSDLLRSGPLWRGAGTNLAVWFLVQVTLMLTTFLAATAEVSDALLLLVLQFAVIVAAALTSVGARHISSAALPLLAALLWCAGASLWWNGAAPFPAALLLGLGLGAGTVLSWARVARDIADFSAEHGGRAEGRAFAGLTVLRDLVSACAPLLVASVMNGRVIGSPEAGQGASLLLIAAALAMAMLVATLRSPPHVATPQAS